MNYNDYGEGEFLNGASINGQLILQDGATLENAKIYSNTNNIANGSSARHNTEPVVVGNGNVSLKGKVFVRMMRHLPEQMPPQEKAIPARGDWKVNGTLTLEKMLYLLSLAVGKMQLHQMAEQQLS